LFQDRPKDRQEPGYTGFHLNTAFMKKGTDSYISNALDVSQPFAHEIVVLVWITYFV